MSVINYRAEPNIHNWKTKRFGQSQHCEIAREEKTRSSGGGRMHICLRVWYQGVITRWQILVVSQLSSDTCWHGRDRAVTGPWQGQSRVLSRERWRIWRIYRKNWRHSLCPRFNVSIKPLYLHILMRVHISVKHVYCRKKVCNSSDDIIQLT